MILQALNSNKVLKVVQDKKNYKKILGKLSQKDLVSSNSVSSAKKIEKDSSQSYSSLKQVSSLLSNKFEDFTDSQQNFGMFESRFKKRSISVIKEESSQRADYSSLRDLSGEEPASRYEERKSEIFSKEKPEEIILERNTNLLISSIVHEFRQPINSFS